MILEEKKNYAVGDLHKPQATCEKITNLLDQSELKFRLCDHWLPLYD